MFSHPILVLLGIPLATFSGMLLMLDLGRRAGIRRRTRDPSEEKERLGAVEGAIFGLLGLLIAFTFAGAAARYDQRRELVVQEANTIGDAWARLDALPAETQPPIRDAMRRYVASRLETYRRLPDIDAAMAELRRSNEIQDEVWKAAVAACAEPEGQRVTMLVLPALDTAFDMTLVRTAAAFHHPPTVIFGMLFLLALASALVAGYGMAGGRRRNWAYMVGFALVISIAVYTILDLEHPRIGFVRVDAADQMLTDVLQGMK
jgi:hypothetical protein